MIRNEAVFQEVIRQAEGAAKDGMLVTFGIVPEHPETGYGYIKAGQRIDATSACTIEQFIEKPNLETAKSYLADGSYYWNSGMFMFRADRYLEELDKYRPDILTACKAAMASTTEDMDFYSCRQRLRS